MKHATGMIVTLLALAVLAACGPHPDDSAYYQPSPESFDFDYNNETSYQKYMAAHIDYVKKHRVFVMPDKAAELALISPFELPPTGNCSGRKAGVLLIHGVVDTAFAIRDVAEFLNTDACMLTRGILLPGHGTRAGDLRLTTKEELIDAVNFGIRTLKNEVDDVYIVGFSLGGLLATHAAVEHPDLAGVILIVPAVQLRAGASAEATVYLRHIRAWIDILPNENPIKYQSMATNIAAEIAELKNKTLGDIEEQGGIKPPLFTLLSQYDITVHSEKSLGVLQEGSLHPDSRFIYYGDRVEDIADDARTEYRSPLIPEERVLTFSHLTFTYAPDNIIFGKNGSFRGCGQTYASISDEDTAKCFAADNPWKGEFFSTEDPQYFPMQRLTYNPHFERMRSEMVGFINKTANR